MPKKSRRQLFFDDQYERLPITIVETYEDDFSSDQSEIAHKCSEERNGNSLSPNSSRYNDEESDYSCESVI
jgi:hypothetical protein